MTPEQAIETLKRATIYVDGDDCAGDNAAQDVMELIYDQDVRIAGLEACLQSALDWASWHRDHPGTINHNAILFDLRAREFLAKIEGATND